MSPSMRRIVLLRCLSRPLSSNASKGMAVSVLSSMTLLSTLPTKPAVCEADVVLQPVVSTRKQERKKQRRFWRRLRRKVRVWIEMMIRSIYLGFIFAPAAITLPLAALQGLDNDNSGSGGWWWQWLRNCVRRSGPCTIKFSQWLSQRPDLFPLLLCNELRDLQINATRHSSEHSMKSLEKAFGPKWAARIYLEKDEEGQPTVIGSGCIAQVFKGRYKKQNVAVKVVHPHAAKSIMTDTNIMLTLTRLLEYLPGTESLSLHESVAEFTKLMLSQLDLRNEAKALDQFRTNFGLMSPKEKEVGYRDGLRFAEPLASAKTVLIESFERGRTIAEAMQAIEENSDVRNQLSQILLDAILKMTFEDNYIHADLHSGNIIVRGLEHPKTSGRAPVEVSLIDTGLVAQMESVERRDFLDLFQAVVQNKGEVAGRLMIERNRHPKNASMSEATRQAFAMEVASVVDEVHSSGLSLGRIGVAALLQKLLVACYRHQVKLESKFVSTVLAIGVVEGLGRRLDPDVDVLKRAAPYIFKATLKI